MKHNSWILHNSSFISQNKLPSKTQGLMFYIQESKQHSNFQTSKIHAEVKHSLHAKNL